MEKLVCPKCGGDEVNQYRMPTGPMWCKCGFRVGDKTQRPNPFVVTDAQDDADLELDDDKDGDEYFGRAIYQKGAEAMIAMAEVKRLREVEKLARKLAQALNYPVWKIENYDLLDRARAVGLLPPDDKS